MGNYFAHYLFDDKKTVLSDKYTAGPHGIGDPEDKSLRKAEKTVLIQRMISETARNDYRYCRKQMEDITSCSEGKLFSMLWTCRPQSKALKSCLEKAYADEGLKEECTNDYLERRSEYRRTGISHDPKKKYGPKVFIPEGDTPAA